MLYNDDRYYDLKQFLNKNLKLHHIYVQEHRMVYFFGYLTIHKNYSILLYNLSIIYFLSITQSRNRNRPKSSHSSHRSQREYDRPPRNQPRENFHKVLVNNLLLGNQNLKQSNCCGYNILSDSNQYHHSNKHHSNHLLLQLNDYLYNLQ